MPSDTLASRGGALTIIKRSLLVLAGLFVAGALLLYANSVRNAYIDYKKDIAGYVQLNVGASTDEVLYVFGYPQEVVGEPEHEKVGGVEGVWSRVFQVNGKNPKNSIPAGKTINDYLNWQWDRNNDRVDVTFERKTRRVTKIGCYVEQSRWDWECPRIFGVNTESHEDDVLELLGQPTWVKYDGVSKMLGYDDLGLVLTLTQERVYMLEKSAAKGATWQWKLRHLFL